MPIKTRVMRTGPGDGVLDPYSSSSAVSVP